MNIHLLRSHIEKIVPLSDEEFALVASYFVERSLKKHQFLVRENALIPYEYWVVSGLLKVSQIDSSGKEHILQFAMEDWWVSDYQAFFSPQRSYAEYHLFGELPTAGYFL